MGTLSVMANDAGEHIRVRGLVQGVGFRPTVWRIANALALRGDVINDGDGVLVRLIGPSAIIDRFCNDLREQCPPLARIDAVERSPAQFDDIEGTAFTIAASRATDIHTGVVADAATCPACRTEIFDPNDRRYRYPFANCTHCGPRLSIVRGIPYDRENTSMAPFVQCSACQSEYDNPADRRFHAQPNACPECGPRVWLTDAAGVAVDTKRRRAMTRSQRRRHYWRPGISSRSRGSVAFTWSVTPAMPRRCRRCGNANAVTPNPSR